VYTFDVLRTAAYSRVLKLKSLRENAALMFKSKSILADRNEISNTNNPWLILNKEKQEQRSLRFFTTNFFIHRTGGLLLLNVVFLDYFLLKEFV
jgi:hypothetical protein